MKISDPQFVKDHRELKNLKPIVNNRVKPNSQTNAKSIPIENKKTEKVDNFYLYAIGKANTIQKSLIENQIIFQGLKNLGNNLIEETDIPAQITVLDKFLSGTLWEGKSVLEKYRQEITNLIEQGKFSDIDFLIKTVRSEMMELETTLQNILSITQLGEKYVFEKQDGKPSLELITQSIKQGNVPSFNITHEKALKILNS